MEGVAAEGAEGSVRAHGCAPVLVAARGYVRRGWRVVPLAPGSKRPLDVAWPQLRLEEAELAAHFTPGRTPGRGVGLLT
jgi:hypothetical protein